MEQTKRFKPYDRVLVRDEIYPKWLCDFYSHYDNEKNIHVTTTFTKVEEDNILHYEGNEHLVGTTDEPEEEVRLEEGEWGFFNNDPDICAELWRFDRIKNLSGYDFTAFFGARRYFIRFSDFNPEDMEETKKHILCVRNGKIVRYREN